MSPIKREIPHVFGNCSQFRPETIEWNVLSMAKIVKTVRQAMKLIEFSRNIQTWQYYGRAQRGGVPSPKGVCQPIILQNCCPKLHENERIWTTGASLAPRWISHWEFCLAFKFEDKQDTFISHLNFYSNHHDKSKFALTRVSNFQFILRQPKISFRGIKLHLDCLILV